jgi:hypothetical protein
MKLHMWGPDLEAETTSIFLCICEAHASVVMHCVDCADAASALLETALSRHDRQRQH